MGAALVHLENMAHFEAVHGLQMARGALGGTQSKAKGGELLCQLGEFRFVVIVDAEKHGARKRQRHTRGDQRFRVGLAEGIADAHDFARGFHFGTEHRIHAWKFGEGKDHTLHGHRQGFPVAYFLLG